jgi:hypothetical protein
MELVQLVYRSRPTGEDGPRRLAALRDIQTKAAFNNRRDGIGGFLVLTRSHFVQVLEGDCRIVKATFERVRRDGRHTEVELIEVMPSRDRIYAAWAMGTIHDELVVRDALVKAGFGRELDIVQLSGQAIASVLAAVAKRAAA